MAKSVKSTKATKKPTKSLTPKKMTYVEKAGRINPQMPGF